MKLTKIYLLISTGAASFGGIIIFKQNFGGCYYEGKESLDGKTVIVTGANQGIGKQVAWDLARRGGRVVMACRDLTKCEKSRREIILDTKNRQVLCRCLDLASFKSIRNFAKDFVESEPRLDILINNAGVMACDPKLTTEDGLEMQMGVNHFGHFLLTHLLLDKMKLTASPSSRIVNVSSSAHRRAEIAFEDLNSDKSYIPRNVYAQSKLANNLFTLELANRLKGSQIIACAVHPGVVNTNIVRHMGFRKSYFADIFVSPLLWLISKNSKQGAQPILHCALGSDIINGKYYSNCKIEEPSEASLDSKSALRLWKISERWVRLT